MSARDDYPVLVRLTRRYAKSVADKQISAALDELDRLRRWKTEALEVLKHWDAVTARFDLSGHLGEFEADAVGAEIDRMQRLLDEVMP